MQNRKSITGLLEEVWKNVVVPHKKSIIVFIFFTWIFNILNSLLSLSYFTIGNFHIFLLLLQIKIILFQVLSAYIVITDKDDLFLSHRFIKLFKENFSNLLGLQLLQILMIAVISLIVFLIFKLYPSTTPDEAVGIGMIMLFIIVSFAFLIYILMIFTPYHVILECGKPVWAFKKGLMTARQNIRLIIIIASIKLALIFFLKSVVFINPLFFLILTILDIIIDIIVAYRCLEEIRNDQ